MKKSIWLGAMTAMMLFASSCQNDEYSEGMEGQTSVVSFTLEQPSIASRGYSDGETVTTVYYAVYETTSNGSVVLKTNNSEILEGKKATVEIRFGENGTLPHGTYDFVFWAAAANGEGTPYTFDPTTRKVTVNNFDTPTDNADKRDAFFAIRNGVKVGSEGVLETITLTRPFAQLNFGAIDEMIAMTPKQSSVKISRMYNTLNLKNGDVEGEVTEKSFSMTDIPQSKGERFPVNGVNQYLSMNYLLVPSASGLIDVEFTLSDGAATTPKTITEKFTNVPVQRNYRTNIYGQMNTPTEDHATFIVEVDAEYEKPNYNNKSGATINNIYYETIEEALMAAVNGDIIYLEEDVYVLPNYNVSNGIIYAQGKTLTFKGAGDPTKTIIKEADSRASEGECDYSLDGSTITFEDLTIETSNEERSIYPGFARCNGTYTNCIINGVYTLYTIKESNFEHKFNGCTFNVTGDKYNLKTWGSSATFTDCTFNCDGKAVLVYQEAENHESTLTFNNCIFNDSDVLVNETKAAIETGANNTTTKYTLNINNCTVNGFNYTEVKSDMDHGGTNSGSHVWGNKNMMTSDNLNVFINGSEVY